MNTRYVGFTSDVQRDAAETALHSVKHFLPSWLSDITVMKRDQQGEEKRLADVSMYAEYRSCCIVLYPAFFENTADQQHNDLYHEITHCVIGRLTEWVEKNLLEPVQERNKELYEFLYREFTERVESVVSEFGYIHEGIRDDELEND